jgi:hypothetical protein
MQTMGLMVTQLPALGMWRPVMGKMTLQPRLVPRRTSPSQSNESSSFERTPLIVCRLSDVTPLEDICAFVRACRANSRLLEKEQMLLETGADVGSDVERMRILKRQLDTFEAKFGEEERLKESAQEERLVAQEKVCVCVCARYVVSPGV